MSAATDFAMKTLLKSLLKAAGMSEEDLHPAKLIPQLLAANGVAPEDAQRLIARIQQHVIDYERIQAQNNMRLMAIMNHLMIVDPVLLQEVEPRISEITEEKIDA